MRRRNHSTAGRLLALCCLLTLAAAVSCVRTPRRQPAVGLGDSRQTATAAGESGPPVNLNTASRDELERLPGVGPALASRIVEHRERHGPFRRPEHLLLVRGFSDSRFRELRPYIAVE